MPVFIRNNEIIKKKNIHIYIYIDRMKMRNTEEGETDRLLPCVDQKGYTLHT